MKGLLRSVLLVGLMAGGLAACGGFLVDSATIELQKTLGKPAVERAY